MKMNKKELERLEREKQQAMEFLKKVVREGSTIYTVLRHVSQNGLTRSISVYAIVDNEVVYLDWYVATVLNLKQDIKHDGIKISGVGSDLGFEIVYNLSYFLFGNGYKLKHKWLWERGEGLYAPRFYFFLSFILTKIKIFDSIKSSSVIKLSKKEKGGW